MVAFTSVLSAFALAVSAVSAYTTPVGNPSGNPIFTPSLNELVPAGTPFEITWNPTTTGTVSLVLLRGPSTNVVPLYAIVEKIPNSGKYSWTPSTSLEPDVTHYGLQLIDDATGQYQYSTQFGISNPSYSSASSSIVASTSSAPVYTSSVPAPVYTTSSAPAYVSSTSVASTKTSLVTSCTSSSAASYPTFTPYPSNTTSNGTTASPVPYTGAASVNAVKVGMGMVAGAIAVFAAAF